MYRGVFTVGVVVTNNSLMLADALPDYSYVTARHSTGHGKFVARCLTGLGPSSTINGANGLLGGLYFNGSMITNSGESGPCTSAIIQARPESVTAGVINFHQCQMFTIASEGVYTCTMMNSSLMNESVRFGIYFSGRSESHLIYVIHFLTIFISLHSCSSNRHSIIYCNSYYWFFPHIILYLTRLSSRHIYMEEG